MLRDNGFTILGMDDAAFDELLTQAAASQQHTHEPATGSPCGTANNGCATSCGGCAHGLETTDDQKPVLRRRGAGTEVPANA